MSENASEIELKEPVGENALTSLFQSFQIVSDEVYDKFEAEEEKRKLELNLIQQQAKFESSGVGAKFFKYSLDDYIAETEEQKKSLQKVKEAIAKIKNHEPVTMWLYGNNGNGKTLLSAMIIKECGGRFVRTYDIEDELKDTERFHSEETRTMFFARYAKYPLLVIDEVGRVKNDVELKFLFHILNDRYENNRSTILVSNLSAKELKDYLGKALVDRFIENCTTVQFNEESFRVKTRKKEIEKAQEKE